MSAEQEFAVATDDALARLAVIEDYDSGGEGGPAPHVHTFAQAEVGALIGAHWELAQAEAFIREHGAQESGAVAAAMGHGLVVVGEGRTIFFATKRATEDPDTRARILDREDEVPGVDR